MCGIIGMAGNLGTGHKPFLRDMLHCCELRGEDSTGIFHVRNTESEAITSKVVGGTRAMFETLPWDRLSPFGNKVIVGHCRKATVGGVSRSTAHPFTHDHITGVHNGTLRNWTKLPVDNELTDSSTLFKAIAANGAKDTIEATDGAYAAVWWDANDEQLNIIRNKERPLYYAFSADGTALFFASESWMITINADRNGVKLLDLTPKESTVQRTALIDEDILWRVKPRNATKDALTFLEDVELKGGVNLPVVNNYPFQGTHYGNRANGHWEMGKWIPRLSPPDAGTKASGSPSTPNLSSTTQKPAQNVLTLVSPLSTPTPLSDQTSNDDGSKPSESSIPPDLNDSIKALFGEHLLDINGVPMTSEQFDKNVYGECQWCQQSFSYDELVAGAMGEWIDEDRYVCNECSSDESGNESGSSIVQHLKCMKGQ